MPRAIGILTIVIVHSLAAAGESDEPRRPVPASDRVARSRAKVVEVFGEELSAATTPAKKSDVARQLIEQADASRDPDDRFTLLAMALDKAIEAGDASVAIPLVERVPREYSVEEGAWRLDALTRLLQRSGPGAAREVATVVLAVARQASVEAHDDVVSKAIALAAAASRKAKDADLVAQVTRLQRTVKQRQTIDRELRPLLEAVAVDPGNPAANGAAGLVLCFEADRWSEGLPLLAKGDDGELRSLAVAEMNVGGDPATRLRLADTWWTWGDSQKSPRKAAARARAGHHYEQLVNSLSGLDKARIEKRLAAVAKSGGGTGEAIYLADLAEKGVTGQVMFSKDGQCFGKPFTVGGKPWPESITALPKAKSMSSVAFGIPPGALRCRGAVGIFTPSSAKPGEKPASPLSFMLVVDGDVVWRSPPLQALDDTVAFDVALDGGRVIELRTAVSDSDWCCWGTWLDPVLVK